MSHTSVAFNLFESLNMTSNFSSEVVLKSHLFELVVESLFLLVSKVLHLRLSVDTELVQDSLSHRASDTVDFSKLDSDRTFVCEEMSLNSEHDSVS